MESPRKLNSKISATTKICALLAALISCAASIPAHAVFIDGRDWRQPLESTSLSYDDVSSVCDIISGACSGSLYNGAQNIDFSGWTWAGASDIAQLFASLTGKPESTYYAPSDGFQEAPGAAWALAAIDIDRKGLDTGLFHYTEIRVDKNGRTGFTVEGLTRNLVRTGYVNRSYLGDGIASQAITNNPVGIDQPRARTGIWLYREVPAPPTYLLILLALAALHPIALLHSLNALVLRFLYCSALTGWLPRLHGLLTAARAARNRSAAAPSLSACRHTSTT